MKPIHNIKKLTARRKELRNNSTPEEIILWLKLKNSKLGFKFRRQHSVGGYILDFYCPEKKLAIEIDGVQHLSKDNKEYDKVRSNFLSGLDIKVMRFINSEVTNSIEKVLAKIKSKLTIP